GWPAAGSAGGGRRPGSAAWSRPTTCCCGCGSTGWTAARAARPASGSRRTAPPASPRATRPRAGPAGAASRPRPDRRAAGSWDPTAPRRALRPRCGPPDRPGAGQRVRTAPARLGDDLLGGLLTAHQGEDDAAPAVGREAVDGRAGERVVGVVVGEVVRAGVQRRRVVALFEPGK